MKTIWIGTSWKMNKPLSESIEWCEVLAKRLPHITSQTIQSFVIPPFTSIHPVSSYIKTHHLPCLIGAQNMHEEEKGAWTGEISAPMLVEIGATLVELGHSERRSAFNETDSAINKKVHSAHANGLRPLICVGDNADEKHWGVSQETVVRQMKIALHGLTQQQVLQTLIAYEPIWAIGEQGIPATPEQAGEIHHSLRKAICEIFGTDTGQQVPLLYGGSVNLQNSVELLRQDNIDGLFIGRAAWNANGYCDIVQRVAQELLP